MTEKKPGSGLPLGGLVKGLGTTLSTMLHRAHTAQYPDVQPELAPRSRGTIALFEENCTVCMLCARECPDWCIYIESHKETVPATTEGGRDRSRNVLDRFAIDFSLCMYCGICVEVCPFDALFWSPEFEYSEADITDMTHEKDRLREWMWTVPAPPAHEANAELDKVVVAAISTPPVQAEVTRGVVSTSSTDEVGSGDPPVAGSAGDEGGAGSGHTPVVEGSRDHGDDAGSGGEVR